MDLLIEKERINTVIASLTTLINNGFTSPEITNELCEAQMRLNLLDKLIEKQKGCGRKRPAGENAVNPPTKKSKDFTEKMTLVQHRWIQDIEAIEKNGDPATTIVDGQPLSKFLKLTKPVFKESNSRGTAIYETTAVLKEVESASDPDLIVDAALKYFMAQAFSGHEKPPDKFNIQFYGPGMNSPFFCPMRPTYQNTLESIKAMFFRLSTSDTLSSIFNTQLGIKVCAYWGPSGSNCWHEKCNKHIVPCDNPSNNFCLARSMVYGRAFLKLSKTELNSFVANQLEHETQKLMEDSGLCLEKDSYNLDDAAILQKHLGGDYRIVIIDERNDPLFSSPPAKNSIVIKLKENHYDFVPKMHLLKNASDFCTYCFKKVTIEYHPRHCKFFCDKCFQHGFDKVCKPKDGESPKYCNQCKIWYNTDFCFQRHLDDNGGRRKPLCQKRFFCDKCGKIIEKRNKQHPCESEGEPLECKTCEIVHDKEHPYCWLQPEKPLVPERIRYMIYDCETYVNNGKHIANVVVATTYCTVCMDLEIDVETPLSEAPEKCCCDTFDTRKHIFKTFDGTSAVPQFIDYVLKRSDKTDRVITILLALNAGKFDSHLLLECLFERNCSLDIVSQGFKIYNVKINIPRKATIYLKDAVNFFMCPLRNLPATYGFENDATKSFFPFHWNSPENYFKTLPTLPDLKYYGVDEMKAEERNKLIQWHKENYNTPFELTEALVSYCCVDVKVLLKAVVRFRKIMMELSNGLDPFFVASTMAKFAYVYFRANILQKNMLINVGERGYRGAERQSDAALKFFRLYEHQNNVKIQTCTWKDGEFKIPDTAFKVDGVIKNSFGTVIKVLEFLGCFYHACPVCFSDPKQILAGGKTAKILYESTMNRLKEIQKQFPIEVVWECQANKMINSDKKLKEFYKTIKLAPRLELRESALKGGRTENFCFYYKPTENEEIRYIDLVSLYPWAMKQSFPLGDPIVYTSEAVTNLPWTLPEHNPYKGFVLCNILPPTDLKIPLLGYRSVSGNFVFTLCSTCADLQQPECHHSDSQRSWVSAFTHLELNKALALKYKVLYVYEAWDYKRWSGKNGEPELFHKYVNSALQLKVQASGWPVEGESARQTFVEEYYEKEGVLIDCAKVEKNPGKRAAAKLIANSLWGKLCQRQDLAMVKITKSAAEFHCVMSDPTHDVIDFVHLNENTDRVTVKKKEEFQKESSITCLPVACYVTSIARLKLYEYLEQCKKPLYVDTDSLEYVIQKGETPLAEGKYLGEWSREFKGYKIVEFVCGGPKNYANLLECLSTGEISADVKARGFPLTYTASQLLAYNNIKEHVLAKFRDGQNPQPINVPYTNIKRNKQSELLNVGMVKKWQAVFKKSVPTPDLFVLPYGFKGAG